MTTAVADVEDEPVEQTAPTRHEEPSAAVDDGDDDSQANPFSVQVSNYHYFSDAEIIFSNRVS